MKKPVIQLVFSSLPSPILLVGLVLAFHVAHALAYCSGSCPCCPCPSGQAQCMTGYPSCEAACGLTTGPTSSGFDNEAARQAQEAAQRAEEERLRVEQQQQEEARKRAQDEANRQAKFIQDRDEAASSLKGSLGSTSNQLKGVSSDSDSIQLKGSSFDSSTSELKGSSTTQNVAVTNHKKQCPVVTDPNVVDTCNVSSGLPSSVDKAIASVYASAQPGVSERVRKGFQAVMGRDWKVAMAWFVDALNHDPENANLKRLVQLSEYTGEHIQQDQVNKLSKRPPHQSAVQLPQDSDMELLFPGWTPPKNKPRSIASGRMPDDSDLLFLFPGLAFPTQDNRIMAKKLSDLMLDEAIKMTANDPVLLRVSNRSMPIKSKQNRSVDIHN